MMYRVVVFCMALLVPVMGFSAIEITQFDNPEQAERYQTLIEELRCLVCQNQNLADSNAELAQDMRKKTYQLVKEGASHEDVVDFMVKRYGDFVMYRPPFKLTTVLLWVGPFIILIGGVFLLLKLIRGRNQSDALQMSSDDLQRARTLLGEEDINS